MQTQQQRLIRQPFTGAAAIAGGLAAIAAEGLHAGSGSIRSSDQVVLLIAALLVGALILAQLFPIHVHQNTKVHMGSVLLYLMAVLLPPPLAGVAALIGMLAGEVLLRHERDLYVSDIASQVGRWIIVVVLGSMLAHLPPPAGTLHALPIIGAAILLWTGDFLTCPLLLTPVTGESPRTVIMAIVKEAGLVEAGQYLIGILGAIAAQQQAWSMILLTLPTVMVYVTGKRSKELQDKTRTLLEHMADTVDLRDPYTGGHSRRVTEYARGILQELGMHGPDVDLIIAAARLHDIGKIAMPDHVLLKDGKLTDEEWATMMEHPERGADLLTRYPDFSRGVEIVRHHHERWDGQGYPHRLRERDIPFGARVIAVADSYDAMTSDRPYRKGMSPEKATSILRQGRGVQWDGAVVDAFLRHIADGQEQPVAPVLRLVPQTAHRTA